MLSLLLWDYCILNSIGARHTFLLFPVCLSLFFESPLVAVLMLPCIFHCSGLIQQPCRQCRHCTLAQHCIWEMEVAVVQQQHWTSRTAGSGVPQEPLWLSMSIPRPVSKNPCLETHMEPAAQFGSWRAVLVGWQWWRLKREGPQDAAIPGIAHLQTAVGRGFIACPLDRPCHSPSQIHDSSYTCLPYVYL